MSTMPDVIQLTRTLVAMDTINPLGNEHQCNAYLAELLESSGFGINLSEFEDGRSNLFARLGRNDTDSVPILPDRSCRYGTPGQ